MGHTSDVWQAELGVIDKIGGRATYTVSQDGLIPNTTAFVTEVVVPAGAKITRVYCDLGNAPTQATTIDVGFSGDTDAVVDGLPLGTTDFRRVEATTQLNVANLVIGDDDTPLWVDFSRTDAATRLSLYVEYILPEAVSESESGHGGFEAPNPTY